MPDGIAQVTADVRLERVAKFALAKNPGNFDRALHDFLGRIGNDAELLWELAVTKIDRLLTSRVNDVSRKIRSERAEQARKDDGGQTAHDARKVPAPASDKGAVMVAKAYFETYRFRSGRLLADCTRKMLVEERDRAERDIDAEDRTLTIVSWALSRIGDTGALRDWVSAEDMNAKLKEVGNA